MNTPDEGPLIITRARFVVVKLPDDAGVGGESLPLRYLFAVGTEIQRVHDHGATGTDPLCKLRFEDGHEEVFWCEEIERR